MIELAILLIIDWMQFGLAGATFITLCGLLIKMQKQLKDKDKSSDVIEKEIRHEMLEEIEKRDIRLINLQEKTLDVLKDVAAASSKMADSLDELRDSVEEGKNE